MPLPRVYGSAKCRDQLVTDLVHVSDDAVIAVVEYRRGLVGVHCDEHIRVNARDMVHRARDTEAQIQLWLYHNARLPNLKLYRKQFPVAHRTRSGKLSAQQPRKLAVFAQALVLHAVADANYRLARGDVQLGIKLARYALKKLRADL